MLGLISNRELPVDLTLNYERAAQDKFHRCSVFVLGDIGYIDIIQANCGYAEGMPPWLSRLGGWSRKGANQVNATGHGR